MAKPSKKQKDAELARKAFGEVFERNRETGYTPKLTDLPPADEIDKPEPVVTPSPEKSIEPVVENKTVKKTGLHLLLQRARTSGFTHPDEGGWLMLPPEFDAVLALETKAVAQIVLEIMRQTIGYYDEVNKRRQWAKIGHTHFYKLGLSKSQTNTGLKKSLQQGYIIRHKSGDGYEYSIHFADHFP